MPPSDGGGTGDEEEGMIEGDTFWLLLACGWWCSDDDNLGELFLRVALLPALRLQAGESQ